MVKQGYTKTDIGIIPEDWSIVSLIDLVSSPLSYGVNAAAVNYDSNLPQYIRITDITDDGRYDASNKVSVNVRDASNYVLSVGDILFARTGASTGKTYLYRESDGKLVYAGFLIKATVDVNLCDHRYIFWQFHTKRYYDWVLVTCTRSGQPGINGKEYSSYQIPIPPLNEQKEIANALSDIDTLIVNLEKLIAKKKAIKQGAMQELLTGKRRLPGFNRDWQHFKLNELCHIEMGQSPDSRYYSSSEGIPLVQGNADIENRQTIIRFYTKNVTKEASKGDIIFTVRAPVGNVAYAMFDCCIGRGVCALQSGSDFLYHLLVFEQDMWSKFSSGSTFDSINSDTLSNTMFFVPADEKEQAAIAHILADMDKEITVLQNRLIKTQNIKFGMMSELLTGRIRLIDKEDA